MSSEKEIKLLEENYELRQKYAHLEAITLNKFEFPESWRLTKLLTRLLSLLMVVDFARHEQIGLVLYENDCDDRCDKAVSQMILLLRKRLPFGIKIQSIRAIGYRISTEDKVKLRRYAMDCTRNG